MAVDKRPLCDVVDGNGQSYPRDPDDLSTVIVEPMPAAPEQGQAVVGTDAAGNITITATDVNGVVTTATVPAPGPQATVADNGDGTGTVTDSDGNACVVVKGPLTQASVADNGDETATITDSAGNECVVAKGPHPATPELGTLVCDTENGTVKLTDAHGTPIRLATTLNGAAGAGGGGIQLTPDDSNGPIEPGFSIDFVVPDCGPHRVQVIYTSGFQLQNGFQANATMQFNPEYSIDGGVTWFRFNSGGVDGITKAVPWDAGVNPEFDYTDYDFTIPVPSGSQTMNFRLNWLNGAILAGNLQINQQSARIFWNELKCCPI